MQFPAATNLCAGAGRRLGPYRLRRLNEDRQSVG